MQQPNPEQAVAVAPNATPVANSAPMSTDLANPFTSSAPTPSGPTSSSLSSSGQAVLSKLKGSTAPGLSTSGQSVLEKLQKGTIQPVPGVESSNPNLPSSSWAMQAITAFNHGVEQVTVGAIDKTVMLGDWLNGTNSRPVIQNYMSSKEAEFQGIKKINPVTATVANAIGEIGALAPVAMASPAGIVAGSAVTGGIAGAIQYNPDEKNIGDIALAGLKGAATGAAIGSVTGAGVAGAALLGTKAVQLGGYLKNVFQSLPLITKSPDEIVDMVVAKAGANSAGNTSLPEAVGAFQDLLKQTKTTATNLYTARNNIADQLGVTVNFDSLATSLTPKTLVNNQVIDPQARAFAKKILNNMPDAPSFQVAHNLMSQLGGKANDAAARGEASLAQSYGLLRDTALHDIDYSASGIESLSKMPDASTEQVAGVSAAYQVLRNAQSVANTYYRESYSPLKSAATANAIMDKSVNNDFVKSLITHLNTKNGTGNTWEVMPEQLKQQFTMSYVNALKAGKTDAAGQINYTGFANQLSQTLQKSPQLNQIGINVQSIAKIAQVAGDAQKGLMGQMHKGGLKAVLLGGPVIAGAIHPAVGAMAAAGEASVYLAAKLPLMTAATKLLNNPDTAPLVAAVENSAKIAPPVINNILSKAASALSAFTVTAQKEQDAFNDRFSQTMPVGIRD